MAGKVSFSQSRDIYFLKTFWPLRANHGGPSGDTIASANSFAKVHFYPISAPEMYLHMVFLPPGKEKLSKNRQKGPELDKFWKFFDYLMFISVSWKFLICSEEKIGSWKK